MAGLRSQLARRRDAIGGGWYPSSCHVLAVAWYRGCFDLSKAIYTCVLVRIRVPARLNYSQASVLTSVFHVKLPSSYSMSTYCYHVKLLVRVDIVSGTSICEVRLGKSSLPSSGNCPSTTSSCLKLYRYQYLSSGHACQQLPSALHTL